MKLRLGRLPNPEVVKMTISMPIVLKEQLEKYMSLHQAAYGQPNNELGVFIAHILSHFLAHDRAFQKALKGHSGQRPARAPRDPGQPPIVPLSDSTSRS